MQSERQEYPFHPAAELFPMHSPELFAEVCASLTRHGWDPAHPIVLYEGQILDGRNRYRACQRLGIAATFTTYSGNPYEKAWLENGTRRDLDAGQKGAIRLKLNLASETWQAEQQQRRDAANAQRSAALSGNTNAVKNSVLSRDKTLFSVSSDADSAPAPPSQWTHTALAQDAGIGEATAGRLLSLAHTAPDLLDAVAKGALTLPQATREARRAKVTATLEDLTTQHVKALQGVFDVVVIDPPWPMEKIDRDVRPNQTGFDYPTMTLEALAALVLPCAPDCHVWLWTTQRFLRDAFALLDVWRLRYVCTFVWHKPGGMQPVGLPQYNCEFALYARKGTPFFLDTTDFSTCFEAPRGRHSEKPEAFYHMVRRVTGGRRVDMFGRRAIDGFVSWGQEAGA